MERQKDGPQTENPSVFETSNLDLAAYLMLEGIRYLGCYIDKSQRKSLAIMQFLDEKRNARDLERVFMTSSEKRYRDFTKYLLKEVHREIRKTGSEISNQEDGT